MVYELTVLGLYRIPATAIVFLAGPTGNPPCQERASHAKKFHERYYLRMGLVNVLTPKIALLGVICCLTSPFCCAVSIMQLNDTRDEKVNKKK
jgi:hypothetical protein